MNSKSAGPVSLTDLARSFLPKDLKGLLPTSAYMGTATFETPQVAFAYERGWRDSFKRAGFPGPEEEFELAQAQLLPHAKHKILLDASCGSGLFTRRFVQSKNYASVVGLDFSAAMLTQARAFAKDEGLLSNEDDETDETDETDGLVFVRADIARIPFPQESIAGVHAGAAIHCWPDCRAAVAEIARVLEPGGSFCGTTVRSVFHQIPPTVSSPSVTTLVIKRKYTTYITSRLFAHTVRLKTDTCFLQPQFLSPRLPFADNKAQRQIDAVLREVSDAIAGPGGQRGFRQWNVLDLEELMVECGLVDFKADVRDPGFVFYAARKPKKWTEE